MRMFVLFYDYSLIEKTFNDSSNLFPKYKNYGLIRLDSIIKKSPTDNNLHMKGKLYPRTKCLTSITERTNKDIPCEKLFKLFDNEPEKLYSASHADSLIMINMKIIHNWINTKHYLTPSGVKKINIKPAPRKILKNHYGLSFNSFSTGFTDTTIYTTLTPLNIRGQTILLPDIANNIAYWVAEPLTLNPTFEDYVKKYINIVKHFNSSAKFMKFDEVFHQNIKSESFASMLNNLVHYVGIQVYNNPDNDRPLFIRFTYYYYKSPIKKINELVSMFSINNPDNTWVTYGAVIKPQVSKYRVFELNGLPYNDEFLGNLFNWKSQEVKKSMYDYWKLFSSDKREEIIDGIVKGMKL